MVSSLLNRWAVLSAVHYRLTDKLVGKYEAVLALHALRGRFPARDVSVFPVRNVPVVNNTTDYMAGMSIGEILAEVVKTCLVSIIEDGDSSVENSVDLVPGEWAAHFFAAADRIVIETACHTLLKHAKEINGVKNNGVREISSTRASAGASGGVSGNSF